MPYSKKMLEYCENPKHIGSLDEEDPSVGTGVVGSPVCGDMLKFQIRVEEGVIVDAKFKTFGCGGAISSSSLITEKVLGKTLGEALKLKNKDIVQELELPKVKIHCSVMAEEAIGKAIEDYRNKNNKNNESI
ncbi:MAG: iron-sulfur cluster assembly scaffold protein [Rickettsiales bacterium]|jgi:nitrogen fixation NifU-like protein|nr:iron-sulfur cluster assembly scaffold protein [Rickettsiales bacterium]